MMEGFRNGSNTAYDIMPANEKMKDLLQFVCIRAIISES